MTEPGQRITEGLESHPSTSKGNCQPTFEVSAKVSVSISDPDPQTSKIDVQNQDADFLKLVSEGAKKRQMLIHLIGRIIAAEMLREASEEKLHDKAKV